MLTTVTAYSQWSGVSPLVLKVTNKPENDLFEVRNIDGLGAVKADVNTTQSGSSRGEQFTGSNTGKRNLVFTIGLTPDWDDWTPAKLRRYLDLFFSPEQDVRLVFSSSEFSPVEIFGHIESNEPNIFSKDLEHQVSIICEQPDFVAVDPINLTALTNVGSISIDYQGTVETGFVLDISHTTGPYSSAYTFTTTDSETAFQINTGGLLELVDATHDLVISSVTRNKFIHRVNTSLGTSLNLLKYVGDGSVWQTLVPGIQDFEIVDYGGGGPAPQQMVLSYYERFGSL